MLQYRDELAQRLSLPPPENGKTFPDPNNNNNAATNCLKTTMTVKATTMVNNTTNTTNNNIRAADKYSLRPRSIRSIRINGCIDDDNRQTQTANSDQLAQKTQDQTNGLDNGLTQTNGLQLNGANITQLANGKSSRPPKPKQKPAPLSKYRRKTANARERSRMREINSAFEALRRAVPHIFVSQCPGAVSQAPSEKLTKITTLRLAMRYIAALSAALNNTQTINNNVIQQNSTSSSPISSNSSSSSSSSISSSSLCSSQLPTNPEFALDLDSLLMESSDAESLCTLSDNSFPLSDQPLTPVTFDDNPLTDATNVYFGDQTLSLDFTTDHSLSPDFSSEHSLSPFDQFLPHFS